MKALEEKGQTNSFHIKVKFPLSRSLSVYPQSHCIPFFPGNREKCLPLFSLPLAEASEAKGCIYLSLSEWQEADKCPGAGF